MNALQIRDAKARFSAVVQAAEGRRPTLITRHGRPAAVVTPVEDASRLYGARATDFVDWLLSLPGELDFERDASEPREIEI